MSYTERFTEAWELLGKIDPAAHSGEVNSGSVDCKGFNRIFIIVQAGALGGNAGIDIESQAVSGGTLYQFDSGNKDVDLTASTDNNTVSVIEIRGEEFDHVNGRHFLNVEVTPASSTTLIGVTVWGAGRYQPAATTGLDSVTD